MIQANKIERTGIKSGELYRAFWRWHFYAGLFVLPVLILMASTGVLYLFKDEIEGVIYRSLITVEPRTVATSPEDWVKAAEGNTGGRVVLLTPPATASNSAQLVVETLAGAKQTVFVDLNHPGFAGDFLC